jgi:SecD/SecF fusion protein
MDKYYKWKVLLLVAVIAFSVWKAFPLQEKINLGLDLQGGMQLLLEVQLDKVPAEARKDSTERVVEIIRNRIDELGVREPIITKQGLNQVVVQLPGVTDRERAAEIVGKTAHLEFRLVSDDPTLLSRVQDKVPDQQVDKAKAEGDKTQVQEDKASAEEGKTPVEEQKLPEGYEYKEIKGPMGNVDNLIVSTESLLSGDHLTSASMGFDQYGQPIVQLQFDKEGSKIFDRVTFQNVNKRLAIVLDGKVHSAPVIRDRIPNGQAQITGNFTSQEASDLALVLRAGALPAPVKIIEERTVGANLGKDSVTSGVRAGIIGSLFVFLFMPFYYLLAGVVADIGLLLYGLITIGTFAAVNATLTLPGIAGFILSVGMAVDANVLIFERIREEFEAGKPSRASVSAGYHKAFSAILDSNLTTLLTSVILFIFGTGPVKGFAVTLSLGIIASMFSAIFVTRMAFDFLLENNPKLGLKMFQFFKKTNIPFLKGRYWAYGFSVLTLALGIGAIVLRGQENYGVEFTGGTSVHLAFAAPVEIAKLREAVAKEGIQSASIQNYGEASQNQFVFKRPPKWLAAMLGTKFSGLTSWGRRSART